MREAIQFERAKDAADARQARIEAAKAHQGDQEANRIKTTKGTTARKSAQIHRRTDKADR
jgi:hypothetical protein